MEVTALSATRRAAALALALGACAPPHRSSESPPQVEPVADGATRRDTAPARDGGRAPAGDAPARADAVGAPDGPRGGENVTAALVGVKTGDDWSLPAWVRASSNAGFFSEDADGAHHVDTRAVDLTWRQLQPKKGTFSTTTAGAAQGMTMPSYDEQRRGPEPFWVRIWASGVSWAPPWVVAECGLAPIGTDYDGQAHLPVWNSCYWNHLLDLYREIFVKRGLRSDPRFKFAYVPGGFTWCEFDFDIIGAAARAHGLTFPVFDTWFQAAMKSLVAILNGENDDPSDDYAYKLVYTGEDYPFGPWKGAEGLLARDAVAAGMGIRTGITELFNFHLNHVPAYGTTVAEDGHMVTDESWQALDGKRVLATENECYNECGFKTTDPYYAVVMSNLKALQLRMNWLYVVPRPSYMDAYAAHWEYVRLSLGKTVRDTPDAWVFLREFEDTYWKDQSARTWTNRPWIRNFERWLVQRDVLPDGVSVRGSEVRSKVLSADNGTSYEGRATDHAGGSDYLYFDLDDRFAAGPVDVEIKVTFRDRGKASWWLELPAGGKPARTPPVLNTNSGELRTATWKVSGVVFDGSFRDGTDFRISNGGQSDLEVRFVRVVRARPRE